MKSLFLLPLISLAIAAPAIAAPAVVAVAPAATPAEAVKKVEEAKTEAIKKTQSEDFTDKFNLGAGLAFITAVNGVKEVRTATVDDNKILRVDEQSGSRAGVILENHWLFGAQRAADGKPGTQWRHGIFVCTELGDEKLMRSFGLGYMASFRSFSASPDATQRTVVADTSAAFNLGIGLIADPAVKVLGDGLHANQPMPAGDTIRFREKTQVSAVLMFSASF